MTSTDRIARVILGVGLIAFVALSFSGTDVVSDHAFSIAFALLGVDVLVTGTSGFSPLYCGLGCKSLVAVTRQPR